MTKLMKEAIDTLRNLPAEVQDGYARSVLLLAGKEQPVVKLTPEEHADLDAADAEIERGELATDADLRAIWAKHSL